jgi:FKBP-type peptidyl-prolyl cis-trans isomerase/predicted small secreted protein
MKKIALTGLVLAAVLALAACGNNAAAKPAGADGKTVDLGYALGVSIGSSISASLKTLGAEFSVDSLVAGLRDVLDGKTPKVSADEANQQIQKQMAEIQTRKAEKALAAEKEFFPKNKSKAGVTTTASGLQYEVVTKGNGAKPKATDTVKVDYVGKFLDGTEFDSSIKRGQPAEFPLNGVIPGWTEGIQLMSVGSKFTFYVPSALAYGPEGRNGIPGNSTLVFDVTLLDIVK